VKKVGKAIKKVASSKIGKALLIAATIYVGGAALGAWQSPFASINGALAGGAKASAGSQMLSTGNAVASAGTAANTVGPMASGYAGVATPAAASTGFDLAALSSVPGVTPGLSAGAAASAANTVGPIASGYAETAAPSALSTSPVAAATDAQKLGSMVGRPEAKFGAQESSKGIISRIMSGTEAAFDFMKANPKPTAMMLSAAGSAASPDEIDVIREQRHQQDRDRERREKNLDIAGININMRATDAPLTDTSGNAIYGAGGIINRARTGRVF